MPRVLRLWLLVAAVAAASFACSPAASGGQSASAGPADVSISAKDLKFNPTSVTAPAGRAFTIAFDNQEAAPHNVEIGRDSTFSQSLFRGEPVSSTSISYSVPALAAGTYAFKCTIHPDMTGTITAQ